jgi:hypothetical protein
MTALRFSRQKKAKRLTAYLAVYLLTFIYTAYIGTYICVNRFFGYAKAKTSYNVL